MDRLIGVLGIVLILGIAYLVSNNRKAINYRTVGVGLLMQLVLAIFILKVPIGQQVFKYIGDLVTKVLTFSDKGAVFVFGPLADTALVSKSFGIPGGFIFFFKIIPTILFVAVLVNIAYHIGLMQRVVQFMARGMKWLMDVSGAEALSNISSAFVGQVEAQIMIKPYLRTMTMSELMSSMTGSFACIAGGVMATYITFGIPAQFLIAASIMAAPGALAISKIIFPETEESQTKGVVKLAITKKFDSIIDAISSGCSEGLQVGLNVLAMLIGFLALIALIDACFGKVGALMGFPQFSLNGLLGYVFSGVAWTMGVPSQDIVKAGGFMGIKLVANEFVAYSQLKDQMTTLLPKTVTILSFALCGFANFSSVGIQIGGISALIPERRADLAKLGLKALLAGTLTSYLSATIAGILS